MVTIRKNCTCFPVSTSHSMDLELLNTAHNSCIHCNSELLHGSPKEMNKRLISAHIYLFTSKWKKINGVRSSLNE